MKRNFLTGVIGAIIIILIIYFINVTQPFGVLNVKKIQKYIPEISSTYKESYSKLMNELQYARVKLINPSTSKQETLKTIKNKQQLVDIIREFDQLHAIEPQEFNFEGPYSVYTIVMWRDGSSVSHVIIKNKTSFYEGSTISKTSSNKLLLRKIPNNLVNLLEL